MSGRFPPRFSSRRLDMQPQSPDDASALFEAYSDARTMYYWSSKPHESVAESRRYLASDTGTASWQGWTVRSRRGRGVVGTLAAHETRAGVVEIGYMVLRRHWGRGYAREGVSHLIDLAFAAGYRRVMADTDPDNAASNGLLQSLGFTMEGRLRAEWETHIGVRDSYIWGLLRDEWPRAPPAPAARA